MQITCPSCFETFEIPPPHLSEVPCSLDYDCEVCCRPMMIECWEEDGEVVANARGIGEV